MRCVKSVEKGQIITEGYNTDEGANSPNVSFIFYLVMIIGLSGVQFSLLSFE